MAQERGEIAVLSDQPLAALVTVVWGDRMVNIAGFDANGIPFNRTSVTLVQEGDVPPEFGRYVEWMPYQIGQAKKHEDQQQNAA
jgi:hypothetical protein